MFFILILVGYLCLLYLIQNLFYLGTGWAWRALVYSLGVLFALGVLVGLGALLTGEL
jgi:hypothetical protein